MDNKQEVFALVMSRPERIAFMGTIIIGTIIGVGIYNATTTVVTQGYSKWKSKERARPENRITI